MFLNHLLFIIITTIINFTKNEKLIFTEIHFRHGARAPTRINDNGEDALGIKWSTPGELTPVGKRMQYLLGLRNRQRYITGNKFISERFDPHELLVFSSNVNRTLQSVAAQIQGFYPYTYEKYDKLSVEQSKRAVPPVSFNDIENEIEKLNDSALPNNMAIIPIHYITFTNSSINCSEKARPIFGNNLNYTPSVLNFVDEFNKNYSSRLNNYLNLGKDNKFNFSFVVGLCDSVIADEAERKNTTEYYEKTNIDKDELKRSCVAALTINYRDVYHGDANNSMIRYFSSYLLREMSNYMKRRVDDDIQGDKSTKNVSDYSRPKMVFLSGHDTSLSAQEMFFIRFFNLKLEDYILPTYASQIAYEIVRDEVDENERNKLKYSDYKVNYYFNEKLILSSKLDKFLETIDNNTWDLQQVIEFCYGIKNDLTETNVETSIIIIIFMSILILILSTILIFLIFKLRGKKKIEIIDDKNDNDNNQRIINDDED